MLFRSAGAEAEDECGKVGALEAQLTRRQARPYFVYRLDGDNLRFGLNSDELGVSQDPHRVAKQTLAKTLGVGDMEVMNIMEMVRPKAKRAGRDGSPSQLFAFFSEDFTPSSIQKMQRRETAVELNVSAFAAAAARCAPTRSTRRRSSSRSS